MFSFSKGALLQSYQFESKDGGRWDRIVSCGCKQIMKYSQAMSVVALFNVAWSEESKSTLDISASCGTSLRSSLSVACLADRQTVGLEIGFLWLAPGAILFLTFPAM